MYSLLTLPLGGSRELNVGYQSGEIKIMRKFMSNLWSDESGISSVEYALLLAFVAAGIIMAADQLSNAVSNEMEGAATCIAATVASSTC